MYYLQYTPTESMALQFELGYSIGRELESYQVDDKVDLGLSLFRFGDDREQLNVDPSDGFFFQLRYIYRYRLN